MPPLPHSELPRRGCSHGAYAAAVAALLPAVWCAAAAAAAASCCRFAAAAIPLRRPHALQPPACLCLLCTGASATAASVGEVLTLPLDTCKVRLQLQGRTVGPAKYRCARTARRRSVRRPHAVPSHHRGVQLPLSLVTDRSPCAPPARAAAGAHLARWLRWRARRACAACGRAWCLACTAKFCWAACASRHVSAQGRLGGVRGRVPGVTSRSAALWPIPTPKPTPRVLLPPTHPADDPIRDFYAGLMREEGGATSIPTKVAAALTAGTLGVLVRRPWGGGAPGLLRWEDAQEGAALGCCHPASTPGQPPCCTSLPTSHPCRRWETPRTSSRCACRRRASCRPARLPSTPLVRGVGG